jgi:type IV pilus assembly protein PilY1
VSTFLAGFLLTMSQAGNAVTIAQMPLFISAGVTPNVMLVVDNSGSMNSIIWAAYDPETGTGFDSTQDYPDWSPMIDHDCNTGTALQEAWSATNGNINYSTLTNSRYRGTCAGSTNTAPTCASGTVRGRNADGTVTKCLVLPDPVTGGSTRYQGNYLNYLFETYAGGTNLTAGQIPNDYRMNVARNVATNVVNDNSNLRLGLTRFNTDAGGQVIQNCGATTAALNTSIAGLTASTWTPLAETLYEVTRYFRGIATFYNGDLEYTSPILYRCQKNFVIVITDGYPTQDASFPNNDDADVADASRSLPDWDGRPGAGDPPTLASDYPNFPQYSDGFVTGAATDEGDSLYLDDMAKFAYDIDMRTGLDDTGKSFDEGDFAKQNLVTYTIGFTAANQMLADAAEYGTGQYYQANDEATLTIALQAALTDIGRRTGSASSVASNSTRLANDTFIYQARFDKDWGGELLAYPIGPDGTVADLADGETVPELVLDDGNTRTGWNAADEVPDSADRNIYTYNPTAAAGSRGRAFEWANLSAEQQTALNTPVTGPADGNGQDRLLYLRGDHSNEAPNGQQFRPRTSVLGDIVNSDPIYVARQNYGYDVLPDDEGSSYLTYREDMADRTPMVYVAANDGMLHGFAAETGAELLAYMPNAVYPQLSALTGASYNDNHRLINDGAPRAMDAYIDGSWRTILVGSLGGGGKGVYALDVTDPDSFSADDVMWEFTDTNDANMGVAIPSPTIARLANDKWVAIVANGYNSTGSARLFVLDLETGAVIREIDTGVGGDNGLSNPTPVDVDADRITDFVYAGDLRGNMWKFDLSSSNSADWGVAFEVGGVPAPLYTACSSDPCDGSNYQPITARPEVGINPPAGYFVYFGTGRYFADGDNGVGTGANTVYAIRDKNEKGATTLSLPTPGRSNLVQQLVTDTRTVNFGGYSTKIRITSNETITDSKDGWYLDLPTSGERQVSTPILRGGKIIFTTVIPSGDECSAGGDSWLMELDALSGSRLDSPPFDLNRDGVFDRDDMVQVDEDDPDSEWINVSGIGWSDNIVKTPGILSGCPSTNEECKYMSGSSGNVTDVKENAGNQKGRLSWREIQ